MRRKRKAKLTHNQSIGAGFTFIELLVVIAILGIMATTLAVIINPQRQLAKARDTQRRSDLYAILSAIYQYSAEHSGALPDTDGDPLTSNFPTSPTCIGTGGSCFNLASAGEDDSIVPVYMAQIPADPKTGDQANTDYLIFVDANERVVASASGEVTPAITVTR